MIKKTKIKKLQYPPMHRLQSISDIRQGTSKQHRHRISHVRISSLLVQLHFHNSFAILLTHQHTPILLLASLIYVAFIHSIYSNKLAPPSSPDFRGTCGGEEPESSGNVKGCDRDGEKETVVVVYDRGGCQTEYGGNSHFGREKGFWWSEVGF